MTLGSQQHIFRLWKRYTSSVHILISTTKTVTKLFLLDGRSSELCTLLRTSCKKVYIFYSYTKQNNLT